MTASPRKIRRTPALLVLSKFAGAASELDAALLVNAHDIDGMAQAMATALTMSLDERRERWDAMMDKLRQHAIQSWFADFIEALQASRTPSMIPRYLDHQIGPRTPIALRNVT